MNWFKESAGGWDEHAPMSHPVVDLRGLDPPEPLLRILEVIEGGQPGPHVFLLVREPLPLYGLLARAGWRHAIQRDERGCELTVSRDPRVP